MVFFIPIERKTGKAKLNKQSENIFITEPINTHNNKGLHLSLDMTTRDFIHEKTRACCSGFN